MQHGFDMCEYVGNSVDQDRFQDCWIEAYVDEDCYVQVRQSETFLVLRGKNTWFPLVGCPNGKRSLRGVRRRRKCFLLPVRSTTTSFHYLTCAILSCGDLHIQFLMTSTVKRFVFLRREVRFTVVAFSDTGE